MRLSSTLLLLLATATTAPSSCLAFSVHNSQRHRPSQIPSNNKYHSHRRQNLHGAAVTARDTNLSVSAASSTDIGAPGTADLPWSELGFEYRPTKSHLRMVHKDGKWGEAELVEVRELFRCLLHLNNVGHRWMILFFISLQLYLLMMFPH